MKRGKFTPKPGDLFQWHYDHKNIPCEREILFWSTEQKHWVRCNTNDIFLLVSLDETKMSFFVGQNFIEVSTDCNQIRIADIPDEHKRIFDEASGWFYNFHIRKC